MELIELLRMLRADTAATSAEQNAATIKAIAEQVQKNSQMIQADRRLKKLEKLIETRSQGPAK